MRAAGNARLAAMAVGWLDDGTDQSLRAALAACAPQLADLPIKINAWHAQSNPLWWSSSAVIDERFVVKFAWSQVRAIRLWREGMVLERLWSLEPFLPTPELVVLSRDPALVVTRRGHQLDLVMPGSSPRCAICRRQIRHRPNAR